MEFYSNNKNDKSLSKLTDITQNTKHKTQNTSTTRSNIMGSFILSLMSNRGGVKRLLRESVREAPNKVLDGLVARLVADDHLILRLQLLTRTHLQE
jgi:hypothetical protein